MGVECLLQSVNECPQSGGDLVDRWDRYGSTSDLANMHEISALFALNR